MKLENYMCCDLDFSFCLFRAWKRVVVQDTVSESNSGRVLKLPAAPKRV